MTGAEDRPLEPATLEDGTPIALSQLAQVLCDCRIGRLVLDAESVPLDLGRTSRLFSAAQRRAVIVRDRTCAWNGCEVPAAYSEVHHVRWWDRDDGPSDLDNAVLLCSHHHHVVHQHDLGITRLHPPVRAAAQPGRSRQRGPGGPPVAAPSAGDPSVAGPSAGDPSAGVPSPGGPSAAVPSPGGPSASVPSARGPRPVARLRDEPVRYLFRRPDASVINAPPDATQVRSGEPAEHGAQGELAVPATRVG